MGSFTSTFEFDQSLRTPRTCERRPGSLFADEKLADRSSHAAAPVGVGCTSKEVGENGSRPIMGRMGFFGSSAIERFDPVALTSLIESMQCLDREVLVQLMFDESDRYVGERQFRINRRDHLVGKFQDLFRGFWSSGASSFALVHNHPSGSSRPSLADIQMTRHVVALCRALEVGFVDHLIVGASSVVSMRKAGLI